MGRYNLGADSCNLNVRAKRIPSPSATFTQHQQLQCLFPKTLNRPKLELFLIHFIYFRHTICFIKLTVIVVVIVVVLAGSPPSLRSLSCV